MAGGKNIRYLAAPKLGMMRKKYCRFKKSGIKYIDYKNPEFLLKFVNEQGKILPESYSEIEKSATNCEFYAENAER